MSTVSEILAALQEQLSRDPVVQNLLGKHVERDSHVNMDPGRAPWAGVYRANRRYTPRTLGNNWASAPQVRVVVQAVDMRSSAECGETLDKLIDAVIDAVQLDLTLRGTVDMVTEANVEYGFIETDRTSIYFQSAIITLALEV